MNKCLVTKLKAATNNTALLKQGEMRIKISSIDSPVSATQEWRIFSFEPISLEIIGDGYFTDSALSVNKGKIMELGANITNSVYVSNGDYEISVISKYPLKSIRLHGDTISGALTNKGLNIGSFAFSNELTEISCPFSNTFGDLSSLKNTKINFCNFNNTQISGDISVFKNNLDFTYIAIERCPNVFGSLGNIKNLTNLITVYLEGTAVEGDISSISNLVKLTRFNASNVYGDISAIKNHSVLKDIQLSTSNMSGDLSKMPANLQYIRITNSSGSLSWTSRESGLSLFGINTNLFIDNVDKMLQDLANCQVPSSVSTNYKIIMCRGNRTSASDSAVATLQSKGYTVSIMP